MKIIASTRAPKALGPYSQAVLAGAHLYVSGQIAINPETGALAQDSIEAEAKQVMENIKEILLAAGYQFSDLVKTTIFVTDVKFFEAVNGVYAQYFHAAPPARSFVQVAALPKGARVEIEVVAVK